MVKNIILALFLLIGLSFSTFNFLNVTATPGIGNLVKVEYAAETDITSLITTCYITNPDVSAVAPFYWQRTDINALSVSGTAVIAMDSPSRAVMVCEDTMGSETKNIGAVPYYQVDMRFLIILLLIAFGAFAATYQLQRPEYGILSVVAYFLFTKLCDASFISELPSVAVLLWIIHVAYAFLIFTLMMKMVKSSLEDAVESP